MKKLLLAGVACLLSVGGAQAAIVGTAPINVGTYTFSNFTCTTNANSGGFGSCDTLSVTGTSSGILIAGPLAATTFGAAAQNAVLDILIGYTLTTTGPAFSSIGLAFNGVASGAAQAQVVETISKTSDMLGIIGQGKVDTFPTPVLSTIINFSEAVTTAFIMKDIILTAQAPGPNGSTISFVAQVPPTSVPEPMSLALFGTALLGLGVARRRNRKQA